MHSRSYLPQALKLFAIFALVSLSASQATPQRKNDFDLVGNGSGGGVICAACTIIVGLLANDSHPIPPPGSADLQPPIISNLDKGLGMISHVCNLVKLKSPLCGSDTQAKIQQMVLDGTSPDAICLDIGLCTDPTCRLYEETLYASADERPVVARASLHFAIRPLLQNNFPSWVSVAPAPEPDHLPLVDEDGKNPPHQTLRQCHDATYVTISIGPQQVTVFPRGHTSGAPTGEEKTAMIRVRPRHAVNFTRTSLYGCCRSSVLSWLQEILTSSRP